jgi:hypothetical protein
MSLSFQFRLGVLTAQPTRPRRSLEPERSSRTVAGGGIGRRHSAATLEIGQTNELVLTAGSNGNVTSTRAEAHKETRHRPCRRRARLNKAHPSAIPLCCRPHRHESAAKPSWANTPRSFRVRKEPTKSWIQRRGRHAQLRRVAIGHAANHDAHWVAKATSICPSRPDAPLPAEPPTPKSPALDQPAWRTFRHTWRCSI